MFSLLCCITTEPFYTEFPSLPHLKLGIPAGVELAPVVDSTCLFKKIVFIYFREGKCGREGEKHRCAVASHVPLIEGLACDPGTCPDWESNQRPFSSQAGTQSTEPHQSKPNLYFLTTSSFSPRSQLLSPLTTVSLLFSVSVSLQNQKVLPYTWRRNLT